MSEHVAQENSRLWDKGSDLLFGLSALEISSGVAAAYGSSLLASLGCKVVRLDVATAINSEGAARQAAIDFLHRGKTTIDAAGVLEAAKHADIVVMDTSPQLALLRRKVLAPGMLKPGAVPLIYSFASVQEDARRTGSSLTSESAAALSISVGD